MNEQIIVGCFEKKLYCYDFIGVNWHGSCLFWYKDVGSAKISIFDVDVG